MWRLAAPGALVKYSSDVNQTAVADGTLTLFLDPATTAPLRTPQRLPLTIRRQLRVVETTGSRAVVQEDDRETIGPLPEIDFKQRYVIDRGTIRNVASDQAYAYTESNRIDRSPTYAINLPFDAGKGPYEIWKNEVGRSYTFRQEGAKTTRDGLTLMPMVGRLDDAKAQPYYIDQLASQRIPKQLTLAQLTPQLKAQGIDPQRIASQVLPQLTAADRAEALSIIGPPITLDYRVGVATRLLVEPRTGAFVSLDRIDQTLSSRPDIAGIGRVQAILAKPQYRSKPAVTSTAGTLARLVRNPPTTRVFTISYGQTPPSVTDIASYVTKKADRIDLVTKTIPLALLIPDVVLFVVGIALWLLAGRRRPGAPAAPSTAPESSGSTTRVT